MDERDPIAQLRAERPGWLITVKAVRGGTTIEADDVAGLAKVMAERDAGIVPGGLGAPMVSGRPYARRH